MNHKHTIKLISFFIVLGLLFIIPSSAFALDSSGDGWHVEGSTLIIDGALTDPQWGVPPFPGDAMNITEVVIKDGATTNTYSCLFYDFRNLERIKGLSNLRLKGNSLRSEDASNMFLRCYKLEEIDLSEFDFSNITDMSGMFSDCSSLKKINLGNNFDSRRVKYLNNMFSGCSSLYDIEYENIDFDSAIRTDRMFYLTALSDSSEHFRNIDLSNKNVEKIENASEMFRGSGFETVSLKNWNAKNLKDCSNMFDQDYNLVSVDTSNLMLPKIEDMGGMFGWCISLKGIKFKSGQIGKGTLKNIEEIFGQCRSITELDLTNLDISQVTDMSGAFVECKNLKKINISNWNTSNVKDMSSLFYGCYNLDSINTASFDTSKVINMENMFRQCAHIKELNLTNFDTSNVINMSNMFDYCEWLEKLDISSFSTKNVSDGSNPVYYVVNNGVTDNEFEKYVYGLNNSLPTRVHNLKYLYIGKDYHIKNNNISKNAPNYQYDKDAICWNDYKNYPVAPIQLRPAYPMVGTTLQTLSQFIDYQNNIQSNQLYLNGPYRSIAVDGASVKDVSIIKDGESIPLKEAPKKKGYKFVGWYIDNQFNNKLIIGKPIKENTILYPKYVKEDQKTHEVFFYPNNGNFNFSSIVKDGDVVLKPKDPKLNGYDFTGWKIEGTNEPYNFNNKIFNDIKLIASWSERADHEKPGFTYYTVKFDTQGGSSIPSVRVAQDDRVVKPADPVKQGYRFIGWYEYPTDNIWYGEYNFDDFVEYNITLYAVWVKQ